MSTKVRTQMLAAVDAARRQQNAAKAFDQAEREAIIAVKLSEKSQQRVARAITNKLKRVGAATRRELLHACDSSIRGDFATVFDLFIDKKFIVPDEEGGDNVTRYRLAGGTT